MKKKTTAWMALAVSAMMLLASCGDEPAASSQKNNKSSEPTTSSVSSQGGGDSSASDKTPVSTYTVTFNFNYSGSRPTQVKVNAGETVAKPDDPTREGYAFTGWYTEIGCVNLFNFSTPIQKNTVLFAGWDSASVTISYNFNYVGAPAMVSQEVAKGGVATPIEDPIRENYSFIGWYTNPECTQPFDFTAPVNESVTLYAKWELSVATVIFDLGYEVTERTSTQNVKVGEALTKPTDPTREGYSFLGWYLPDAATAFDFATKIGENITLIAKWEILHLTVTFNFNDGVRDNVVVNVDYGETVTEQENVRDGYVSMWTLNGEEFDFSTPITESIVLTASYTAQSSDTFTYTYHYNYVGAPNDGVYQTSEVKKDNRPTLPSEPTRENALFSGWYLDAACTTPLSLMSRASADTDLYARWLIKNRFEAEYVNLDGKEGHGFSVNMMGVDMIYPDNGTGASNGHYVSGLYYEGANIEFDFTSSAAVDDAIVVMAVQVEFDTKTFNPDNYQITVNGVSLDYEEFTIEAGLADSTTDVRRPFIEVEFLDSAVLKEGANVIKMITANNIYHGGTRQGDAPMIDYIDVFTDATLSWNPRTDNIKE